MRILESNEYPQRMFLWRTDKNYPSIIIKYPHYSVLLIVEPVLDRFHTQVKPI